MAAVDESAVQAELAKLDAERREVERRLRDLDHKERNADGSARRGGTAQRGGKRGRTDAFGNPPVGRDDRFDKLERRNEGGAGGRGFDRGDRGRGGRFGGRGDRGDRDRGEYEDRGDRFNRGGDRNGRMDRYRPDDGEHPSKRRAGEDWPAPTQLSSSVVKVGDKPAEKPVPKEETPEAKQRNRRVFGALMGHLQQFKKETEQKTDADVKREEILHKVEVQIEQEHNSLVEQQKKIIAEQKEKEKALADSIRKKQEEMEMQLLEGKWAKHRESLSKFHRTHTKPRLYFALAPNAPPVTINDPPLSPFPPTRSESADQEMTDANNDDSSSKKRKERKGKETEGYNSPSESESEGSSSETESKSEKKEKDAGKDTDKDAEKDGKEEKNEKEENDSKDTKQKKGNESDSDQ